MGRDSENQQFITAYENPKNKAIIFKLLRKYKKKYPNILDWHTLQSAAQIATLKSLRKFKPGGECAYSSFLYRALLWELADAVRTLGKQFNTFQQAPLDYKMPQRTAGPEDMSFSDLDEVLKAYFVEGWRVIHMVERFGLSRRAIKQKIDNFIQTQREILS